MPEDRPKSPPLSSVPLDPTLGALPVGEQAEPAAIRQWRVVSKHGNPSSGWFDVDSDEKLDELQSRGNEVRRLYTHPSPLHTSSKEADGCEGPREALKEILGTVLGTNSGELRAIARKALAALERNP